MKQQVVVQNRIYLKFTLLVLYSLSKANNTFLLKFLVYKSIRCKFPPPLKKYSWVGYLNLFRDKDLRLNYVTGNFTFLEVVFNFIDLFFTPNNQIFVDVENWVLTIFITFQFVHFTNTDLQSAKILLLQLKYEIIMVSSNHSFLDFYYCSL